MSRIQFVFVCVAGSLMGFPLYGQAPSGPLQGGTYNTPAGTGASTPFTPYGTKNLPFPMPPAPYAPQNLLNRDILNPGPQSRLQQYRWQAEGQLLPAAPRTQDGKATIKVKLPAADAKISVNGHATHQTGADRLFVTPSLGPGTYRYRFEVSWTAEDRPMAATRTVVFQPGADLALDFTPTAGPAR